jgi:cob(I)alamin adenosyltransferase
MAKSKIYTKTGDAGETSILSGERVKKYTSRISVYGDIDELNSFIGCAYAFLDNKDLTHELQRIQSALFNIGAVVSCPENKRETFKLQLTKQENITFLEERIDHYDESLPELKNFILPGGSKAASFLHVCRTTCRRAERECIRFNEELDGDIPDLTIKYLNRLSDYFFVLSRYVINQSGDKEVIWINE